MVKKTQIPVVGGIRKVVTTPEAVTPGTTIAEFGAGTISLAQLRQALGIIPAKPNTQGGGGGSSATIVPGPGLSGGGPVLGNIPINLTASPSLLLDEGVEDVMPIPGPTGPRGAAGAVVFILAEDGIDGEPGIPGIPGPSGAVVHFGVGAPSALFNNGDLYFDTTSSPYQGYVQHASVWTPFM